MNGFLHHFWMTLKLNFRNPQAVVFGYLVPVLFLTAFGVYFTQPVPSSGLKFGTRAPLQTEMGQLITISIMGGACFGMPVSFVSERERGVWRRYRLVPMPTWLFVLSLLLARYLIVLTSGGLLYLLAHRIWGTPWPLHPWQLLGGFSAACFAFLGVGLVISMIANSTMAVQALGQLLFLPMIMIGGVGVRLESLAKHPWALKVSAFLPGRYSLQAIDAAVFDPLGLSRHPFNLIALAMVGVAAFIASAKLFRWDPDQKNSFATYVWVLLALAVWLAVGGLAMHYDLVKPTGGAALMK